MDVETRRPQEIGRLHALRPAEFEEARLLIDRCMRPGETLSMAEDFPLLVGEGAPSRRLVIKDSGRIVAHAAAHTHVLDIGAGVSMRLLNIGGVCTDPEARGRGYGRTLVEMLMSEGREAGIEAAILWTSEPGFYERSGFRNVGVEAWFLVDFEEVAGEGEIEIFLYDERRLEELLLLHANRPIRVARSQDVARTLFSLPQSTTFVAVERGAIVAYMTVGKGIDFVDTVCEWGGPPALLPALLRRAMPILDRDSLAIVGSAWDDGYVRAFTDRGCSCQHAPVGMMCPLDSSRLRRALGAATRLPAQLGDSEILPFVFGDPADPERRPPVPFWFPGLDSM